MNSTKDKELAELLTKAQAGNQAAYESFLRQAAATLRVYISKRIARPELAEDVLQETLLAIHRARHSYVPGKPVGPWLYAISRHRVIDFSRQHRRSELGKKSLLLSCLSAFASQLHCNEELIEAVLSALGRLPVKQRSVIELLKLGGLSVREVAAQMSMSENAVKVNACRGYDAIRKKLR